MASRTIKQPFKTGKTSSRMVKKAIKAVKTIKREALLVEALEDARDVLADYCGKGKLSIEHASRAHLRIEQALKNYKEKI